MNKVFISVAVVILVLGVAGVGLYYYSTSGPTNTTSKTQNVVVEASPAAEMMGDEAIMDGGDSAMMESGVVAIEAVEFEFKPSSLSVKAGEKVSLTVKNISGKMPHDWVVEGTDIRTKVLNPGESQTIEFTVDEPGTYTFYCSVGNHRAQGMEGTLVVE
jgi:plastocyanin